MFLFFITTKSLYEHYFSKTLLNVVGFNQTVNIYNCVFLNTYDPSIFENCTALIYECSGYFALKLHNCNLTTQRISVEADCFIDASDSSIRLLETSIRSISDQNLFVLEQTKLDIIYTNISSLTGYMFYSMNAIIKCYFSNLILENYHDISNGPSIILFYTYVEATGCFALNLFNISPADFCLQSKSLWTSQEYYHS